MAFVSGTGRWIHKTVNWFIIVCNSKIRCQKNFVSAEKPYQKRRLSVTCSLMHCNMIKEFTLSCGCMKTFSVIFSKYHLHINEMQNSLWKQLSELQGASLEWDRQGSILHEIKYT